MMLFIASIYNIIWYFIDSTVVPRSRVSHRFKTGETTDELTLFDGLELLCVNWESLYLSTFEKCAVFLAFHFEVLSIWLFRRLYTIWSHSIFLLRFWSLMVVSESGSILRRRQMDNLTVCLTIESQSYSIFFGAASHLFAKRYLRVEFRQLSISSCLLYTVVTRCFSYYFEDASDVFVEVWSTVHYLFCCWIWRWV